MEGGAGGRSNGREAIRTCGGAFVARDACVGEGLLDAALHTLEGRVVLGWCTAWLRRPAEAPLQLAVLY